eukprot:4584327-Pleurochrysis_carterae.AAC.1
MGEYSREIKEIRRSAVQGLSSSGGQPCIGTRQSRHGRTAVTSRQAAHSMPNPQRFGEAGRCSGGESSENGDGTLHSALEIDLI